MKKILGILTALVLTPLIIAMTNASKPCIAEDPPGISNPYQQALDYLANHQNSDGSWGALPERDTALAAEALAWTFNPDYLANIDQAASFLAQAPARNADALSRKIFLGMITGNQIATEEEANYFYSCINRDGGLGLAPGYPSTAIDTSLGVYASLTDGSTDLMKSMLSFIVSRQNEDGSFGLQSGGKRSLFATAMANRALSLYGFYSNMPGMNIMNGQIARAIEKADAWLAGVQHEDGGFGASGSTAYETALVLESVSFASETDIDRQAAVTFLLSLQAPDGSIGGDVATTALFLCAAKPNLRFSQPAIVLEEDEVSEGAPLQAHFRVENLGMTPPGPCKLQCTTDWGTSEEIYIEDIPPGEIVKVPCSISTLGAQGRHEIIAAVSPQGLDVDILDNVATAGFFITAGKNLAVFPEGISVTPQVPDCSQLVTVRAEVANTATVDVRNATVSFYDGDPQAQGAKLGEVVMPYVDAARKVTSSMTTSLSAGSHDIFVVVDEAAAVPELSEEDNRASVQVTVAQSVSIPEPVSPEAGALLATATPTFNWYPSSGADNITYTLDVDIAPDFSSPGLVTINGIAQQPDLVSYTLPGPLADGTWYWRVRASDGIKKTDALEIRSFTIDTYAPQITGMQAQPEWLSPNADGIRDEGTIGFALSEAASVDVRVVDEAGGVVRVLAQGQALSPGAHSLTWDGVGEDGLVAEGEFRVVIEASDAAGNASSAECAIGVDTSPPEVSEYALSHAAFSPNGDGILDTVDADFAADEPGTASLLLVSQQGQVLGIAVPETVVAAGSWNSCWDGRVDGVPTRTQGGFELELRFSDRAGNAAPVVSAHIAIDISAPAMSLPRASITQGAEKEVTISTEIVGAERASAVFAGETQEMALVGSTWTAVFACPAEPGSYTVEVWAEDDAGNTSDRSDVRLVIPATLYGSTMTDTEKSDFEQATSLEGFDIDTYPGEVTAGLSQHASPPDLPYSVHNAPAFEIGGRIYIFGGESSHSVFSNAHKEVMVYDPQTNGYTYAKDMNQARFSPASAKGPDGRIYIFGGSRFDNNGYEISIAASEAYDPSTDTWSSLPSLPNTLTRARAACASDGSIYIFGGYTINESTNEGVQTDEVLRFDPQAGTYTVIAHIPIARCCHTVAAHGNLIYIMGGHNFQSGYLDYLQDCWSFDPASGTFTELASLPLPFLATRCSPAHPTTSISSEASDTSKGECGCCKVAWSSATIFKPTPGRHSRCSRATT
jgi:prenyltransferase beta subunit